MAYKLPVILFSLILVFLSSFPVTAQAPQSPSYPAGSLSVNFTGNKKFDASGSDNWPITWAADDNQYTTFGDGGGFDESATVSFGVARISGNKDTYTKTDIYESPIGFTGKIYGILAVNNQLYFLKCGDGSELSNFKYIKLYKAAIPVNDQLELIDTGVQFNPPVENFFCPSFLQYGKDYAGAPDNYVYIYAPEISLQVWNVQIPGKISLLRVPKDQIETKSSYEYFAGMNSGTPMWTNDVSLRQPVFSFDSSCPSCSDSGIMRTSVSYNPFINRYLLITQQVDRYQANNGHIGIYDAPTPWGPWTTTLYKNAWDISLNGMMSSKVVRTVYWNFSNKWANGNNFVLVYTDRDNWSTIEGNFTDLTPSSTPPPSPTPTPTPLPGDINLDGSVNQDDYTMLSNSYTTADPGADINADGIVNLLDLTLLSNNFTNILP